MIKILLADDEESVVESMQRIIADNFSQICKVKTAQTGRGVIQLAEEFRPDIALIDIGLPGINGIEAIAETKKFCPTTKFIIVSAYDTFAYAKQAIELGVMDFITKPANASRLINSLEKAIHLVEDEQTSRERELAFREKMEAVFPVLENGMIYTMIFQSDEESALLRYCQLLDVNAEHGIIIVVEIGDDIKNHKMTNVIGTSVKAQKFYNEFRTIAKEFFSAVVGPVMTNKAVIFIPCLSQEAMDEYSKRVEVIDKTREMIKKMESRIQLKFRAGIGSVHQLKNIYNSYQEASRAIKHAEGEVLHIMDYAAEQEIERDYPMETEYNMFDSLRKGNVTSTLAMAADFFDWMEQGYGRYLSDIRLKVLELVMYAERIAFQEGAMSYHFRDRTEYITAVEQASSITQIRKWFMDKIKAAAENIYGNGREKYSEIVEHARKYLREHFVDDISLDEVSREVNISPYYFSKIFKDETGQTFIEYLTILRMECAKRLLKESKYSIKQVCIESGYSDPNYFSRIFKKNVGMTPSEFRENQDIHV